MMVNINNIKHNVFSILQVIMKINLDLMLVPHHKHQVHLKEVIKVHHNNKLNHQIQVNLKQKIQMILPSQSRSDNDYFCFRSQGLCRKNIGREYHCTGSHGRFLEEIFAVHFLGISCYIG